MPYHVDDTIAAIASAVGGALRGVIRISGPEALAAAARCIGSDTTYRLAELREPTAVSGTIDLPLLGEVPVTLYVWPTSRSYTRQPAVEVHTFGSPPVLDAILRKLCAAGARLAEPGEFTLRAFLAGRLDLTQAEAVLGVIDAASQRELNVALSQLAGGLTRPFNELRCRLLDVLADLEAGLDFLEEGIEFVSYERVAAELKIAFRQLTRITRQLASRGERRHEARVVLRGSPNVGKSSLLNALVGDQAAIVTDVAGTTRDYVARQVSHGGVSWLLVDTAGVDTAVASGTLDAAVQGVTHQQVDQAWLELFCLDATRPLNAWERTELSAATNRRRVVVYTKADLVSPIEARTTGMELPTPAPPVLPTSAKTGTGLADLHAAIAEYIREDLHVETNIVADTLVRCRTSVDAAAACLLRARRLARQRLGEELVALELRRALEELGSVVGAVYTDDILDRIFSRFCIGK